MTHFRPSGAPQRVLRSRQPAICALLAGVLAFVIAGAGLATPARSLLSSVFAAPRTGVVSYPATPAGAQLRWLVAQLAKLPIPPAQLRAHFDQRLPRRGPARRAERRPRQAGPCDDRVD
jgi:hypothetical protein